MNFRSDNESPAAPEIMTAVNAANSGYSKSYAEDDWSNRLDQAFSALFETDVAVLPVSTGTVANSIGLACLSPPWGSVYCHADSHILQDEGGAPEFYGHGLRIVGVEGENGRIDPKGLRESLLGNEAMGIHSYVPSALSLTNCTEAGTVYQPADVAALCRVAAGSYMPVHMDGARIANAIATLRCSPADISWKAGVNMLSFGASKNGCLMAEALLFFNASEDRIQAERMRKRGGHLLSKMRFVSAQLLAYIEDGRWLRFASHANNQAAIFAQTVERHDIARLEFPVEANQVFVRWNAAAFDALEQAGVQFFRWSPHDDLARFVFSHHGSGDSTTRLCEIFREV